MGMLRRRKGRQTWSVRYRDEDGIVREVSTGCKDKSAARQVLNNLERHAEKVQAGLISRQESTTMAWATVPITEQIEAQIAHMTGLGRADSTVYDQKRLMEALVAGCGWKRVSDMTRPQLERWLSLRVAGGLSARTRNAYAVAAKSFANWLVRAGGWQSIPIPACP